MEIWVEIIYFDGVDIQYYYGTVEGSIEKAILEKSTSDWVCLRNPRFLDESGTKMEIFEEDIVGTEPYFYIRAGSILRVAPIKTDVSFWAEGKPPIGKKTKP